MNRCHSLKSDMKTKEDEFMTMFKLFLSLIIFLFVPLVHAKTIKIATLSPEGSSWMQAMRKAGKSIEEQTEGRVKLKFFPGGVMGDDKTVLRKMRIGQLQGTAITAAQLAHSFTDGQLYNMPFIFKNEEEVDHVRKAMDQKLVDGFKKSGYQVFGIAEVGFAYLMSKNEITTVKNLQSSKVWVPSNDPASVPVAKAFDVSPIPLPLSDVLTGLQTGLIDTVGSSLVGALALQWHTQVKYIVDTPLMYIYGVITINNKTFNKLSEQDQGIVSNTLKQATIEMDTQARADNIKALEALKKQGLKVINFSESEEQEMLKRSEASWKNLVESGVISQGFFNDLNHHLNELK